MTGLVCREYPEATIDWLRCQIGEYEAVKIQTSAFRLMNDKVFRLRASGATWEEAVDLLERRQKLEEKASK